MPRDLLSHLPDSYAQQQPQGRDLLPNVPNQEGEGGLFGPLPAYALGVANAALPLIKRFQEQGQSFQSHLPEAMRYGQGANQFVRILEEAHKRASQESPIASGLGGFAGEVAKSVPFYRAAAPVGSAIERLTKGKGFLDYFSKLLGHGATAGVAESAMGIPEDRGLERGLFGAGVGMAIPAAFSGLGGAAKKLAGLFKNPKTAAMEDIASSLLPSEVSETINTAKAAKGEGVNLSPGEASGNPLLGLKEGRLTRAGEDIQKQLYEFKHGQKEAQKGSVGEFLSNISPDQGPAAAKIVKASEGIIDDAVKQRQALSQPFYERANKKIVSPNKLNPLLKDSNIAASWDAVLRDPVYQTRITEAKPNSIEILQLVKENMDDRISAAFRAGENKKGALITQAKNKLLTALDEISPAYKKARSIYAGKSEAINELLETPIGKLSELGKSQEKNVGKIIFDPGQTDIGTLTELRDNLLKKDPDAWYNLVRNSLEGKLETSRNLDKTGNWGSALYEIFANKRTYKQYQAALQNNPDALKSLEIMREAFRNLKNSITFKTAAGQSETSMSMPRSAVQAALEKVGNIVNKKNQQAMIDLIVSGDWVHELEKMQKVKDPNKYYTMLQDILKKAAKQHTEKAVLLAPGRGEQE